MLRKILITILGLAYALCPYDLLPDFFFGFGWIDDIIVLIILWSLMQRFKKGHDGDSRSYGQSTQGSEGRPRGASHESEAFSGRERSWKGVERNDPYEVLGVGRSASPEEIKGAYKRLANRYHPDKVAHLGQEFQKLAEERFKEIQQAYQELTGK